MAALGAILVGGLAAPPPAAAAKMSCNTAMAVAQSYINAGNVFYGLGDVQTAVYWYGKAEGVLDAAC